MQTSSPRTPPARRAPRAARGRLALLALGGASMLAGLNAGLVRLEVWAPVPSQRAGDVHGLVMVLGFLATLISLERAQALGARWAYAAPGLLGAGALALLTPAPLLLGHLLLIEGCLIFLGTYFALWRRVPRPLVTVQVFSAVLALVGAVLALLVDIPTAVPWLIGFIVLTIASERAELAALSMGERAEQNLTWFAVALGVGATAALSLGPVGERLLGLVVVAVALWLLRRDVAGRQLRLRGQHRYLGAALFAGYLHLGVAGFVLAWGGLTGTAAGYEVIVHGVFLGFAVSMVMAHAPVILPAVLGRRLPYHRLLWLPLGLLHVALLARYAGAVASLWNAGTWQLGGQLSVLAMLVFVATALTLVVTAKG